MSRPQIVLTNIRESRAFIRNMRIEDALNGKGGANFSPIGPVERWLVFNDGAFEVPCGDALYEQISRYLEGNQTIIKRRAVLPETPPDIPEGASTFSAEDEIPPPPEDEPEDDDWKEEEDEGWSGTPDEAEDGVGQL